MLAERSRRTGPGSMVGRPVAEVVVVQVDEIFLSNPGGKLRRKRCDAHQQNTNRAFMHRIGQIGFIYIWVLTQYHIWVVVYVCNAPPQLDNLSACIFSCGQNTDTDQSIEGSRGSNFTCTTENTWAHTGSCLRPPHHSFHSTIKEIQSKIHNRVRKNNTRRHQSLSSKTSAQHNYAAIMLLKKY